MRASSPYLRQHAGNPVDWYEWGPEALQRAREEDRPILLSVGYSSCHWCHVMERESFEDHAIAALMNQWFVNVKVDREERPDIDQTYMKAVQAMTGRGGWPMTVFLTPEQVPFFGGTYYPPEPRPGMPSFPQILEAVADAWTNRREDVRSGGERLLEALRSTTAAAVQGGVAGGALESVVRQLEARFDARWGGFGPAPKFPQAMTLELLLDEHERTDRRPPLEMTLHTLRAMAAGGLRDHLAGGFHRYSVDERWLVPHFEKMLYDNALLARAYLGAWRVTDSDDLKEVAVETLDWILSDLTSPTGCFYSAWDADSEGEEGVFYVWTPEQVHEVLGEDDGSLFCRAYDVTEVGNFEGVNILHLSHPLQAVAAREGTPVGALEERLRDARGLLLEVRRRRPPPFRDEKVIGAWNGLAIRAFAEAGATLGIERFERAAVEAGHAVWELLGGGERLLRSALDGTARHHAFLEDHGALANAYLSLHSASLDPTWLERAIWLVEEIRLRFIDEESGRSWDSAHDAEELIVRPHDPTDGATPSGNSLAAEAFYRLGRLLDRPELLDACDRLVTSVGGGLEQYGSAFSRILALESRRRSTPVEIVVAADNSAAAEPLLRAAHRHAPTSRVITGFAGGSRRPDSPLLEGREPGPEGATAWICSGYVCRMPVTDVEGVSAELDEIRGHSSL